jgi:hypothetical protein
VQPKVVLIELRPVGTRFQAIEKIQPRIAARSREYQTARFCQPWLSTPFNLFTSFDGTLRSL